MDQSPIRVLIVTHDRKWNGETEYAVAVARAEAGLGLDVTFVSVPGNLFIHSLDDSVKRRDLPRPGPHRYPRAFLADTLWLSGLIRRERFTLVHSLRGTSHVMTALALRGRAPLFHLKGGARKPSANLPNRFLYRSLTAAVLVSSSRLQNWVTDRLTVPPERVHLLFTPVDTERFQPSPPDTALLKELKITEGSPVILMVARLAPVKGHGILLKAMARVRREFPRALLVLVGRPWEGQPEALRRQAFDLGIGGAVIFTGHRQDIARFLSIASVGALSSLGSEENSRTVSEYLACAKPVVATAVGVVPELVNDNRTGFLVPPGNPEALGDAIANVLRDPEKAKKMGKEALRFAQEKLSREAFARGLRKAIQTHEIYL